MSFVSAKFPLPTVSKADGTLRGYVQYQGNPRGDQFIWPAQRIAIFLAKQKADAAKKKTNLGVVTPPPAGPAADIANAVWQAGPNGTYQDLVDQLKAGPKQKTPNAPQQPNTGMNYALALGGILVGGGVIIALVKALSGGARTGRPIPGAHVYEGL
jgi:hypothetical protein